MRKGVCLNTKTTYSLLSPIFIDLAPLTAEIKLFIRTERSKSKANKEYMQSKVF